jgi:RNA polymerase sigma-70 factor (ECF subfamily)
MNSVDGPRAERFTDLYEAHYAKVLAYCRRRLPAQLASDAVADTFATAWHNLDRLSGDPLLWLYGLARGIVSNQRRGLARVARLQERVRGLANSAADMDHMDDPGCDGSLLKALEQLSPDQQEALRLTSWEELTLTEAAAVVGCSPSAFKVRVFRARRRMRQLLEADRRAVALNPRAGCPRARLVLSEGDRER